MPPPGLSWPRRPLAACAVLLAAYVALSFLNDPRAYLGTDTGGKVATLEVMTERGRLDPDIGYWAERWDPEGRVHPLYYTTKVGDRWVNATTLPMLYAAYPLYDLGGYRLALLLPMLGSLAAALAARALARRLSGGDGWAAFWIVGLASPLLIYALDFWEHSLGVAAMAWAAVLLVDVVERRRSWPWAAPAGALLGVAATLRTEALVYAFVAVGLACLVLLVGPRTGGDPAPPEVGPGGPGRRPVGTRTGGEPAPSGARPGRPGRRPVGTRTGGNSGPPGASAGGPGRRRLAMAVLVGAVATAGLALPLLANAGLEAATVGEPIRTGRAAGTASSAVSTSSGVRGQRLEEAMLNAAAITPRMEAGSYLVGGALLALLVYVAVRTSRPGDAGPAVIAAAGIAVLYAIRFSYGPGFVPGLVAATPIAAVGLALGWATTAARYLLGVGLLALPLVWATQFQGGAAPQWAGRYLLASGLLFAVVGIVALPRLRPWAQRALVGLAVVVTGFGLVWTSIRTHGIGDSLAALSRRPEPVLVSRIGHLFREGGVFHGERRWLTAPTDDDEAFAVDVLGQAGVRRFGVVQLTAGLDESTFPGWRKVGDDQLEFVDGIQLTVTTYEAR